MAEEFVEQVRAGYEAMNRAIGGGADLAGFVREAYDPEIVMEMGVLEGTITGWEAVQRFIEGQAAIIEDLRSEPEEIIPVGECAVVSFRLSGRARNTGLPFEVHLVHVIKMRDGRALHVRLFTNRAKAMEALGLPA